MNSHKKTARLAGLFYLIVVTSGIVNLMYIPSHFIVRDNIATTISNISAGETVFRLGILCGFICYTAFLILPLLLYKLLSPVHKNTAVLMVALAMISVPIAFINMEHKMTLLNLATQSGYFQSINPSQIQLEAGVALTSYENGIRIVTIFWGLWLLPFGYLVFRSRFLPKIFGILLMVGCVGYLVNFIGHFLFPAYTQSGIASYVSIPSALGEIGICLWLLIMGAKKTITASQQQ